MISEVWTLLDWTTPYRAESSTPVNMSDLALAAKLHSQRNDLDSLEVQLLVTCFTELRFSAEATKNPTTRRGNGFDLC